MEEKKLSPSPDLVACACVVERAAERLAELEHAVGLLAAELLGRPVEPGEVDPVAVCSSAAAQVRSWRMVVDSYPAAIDPLTIDEAVEQLLAAGFDNTHERARVVERLAALKVGT